MANIDYDSEIDDLGRKIKHTCSNSIWKNEENINAKYLMLTRPKNSLKSSNSSMRRQLTL